MWRVKGGIRPLEGTRILSAAIRGLHVLYLELGVGGNTPVIIKYPFWKMTSQNPDAVYACINRSEAYCPAEISRRSICIEEDIGIF